MVKLPPQNGLKQKAAANGYLFVQTMMWGLSFIMVKNITSAMSVIAFLAIRFILATLMLLPFFVRKLRAAINPAFLKATLLLGGLVFISMGLQTYGLKYTSVTNSSFITSTTVLLVPLFEWLIFKKKLPRALWLGCIVAFAGIVVLAGAVSLSLNVGDALTALCAMGFALQILFSARFALRLPADSLGFSQMVLAGLLFTALWAVEGFTLAGFKTRFIGALLFMTIANTAVSYVGQLIAFRYTEASIASLIFALEPIFATVFAMIIPDQSGRCETLTLKTALGALAVLAGVTIALWDSFRNKKSADAGKAACELAE